MVSPSGYLSLDGYATRLRRLATLGADVEHAVAVVGGNGIGIHVIRQAQHAPEAAAEALVDMNDFLADFLGRQVCLPLAGDCQYAPVQVDLHAFRIEPGGEGEDLHGLRRAADIERRKAAAAQAADA